MLKLSRSTESTIQPVKNIVGVGCDSRVGLEESKLDGSKLNRAEDNSGEVDNEIEKKGQKTSMSKKSSKSKKT